MLKIISNLKYTFWSVVVIVILLCVQATIDLALPEYTSKIVNVGIQAGGIESSVPSIISKDDMEEILQFTDKDDEVLNNYSLIEDNKTEYQEKIVNQYLGKDNKIEPNTIYVLNQIDEDKLNELSSILVAPLIKFPNLKNKEFINMPEQEKEPILAQLTDRINEMSDSIKEQTAVSSIKLIYKDLGIDTDKLQNNYILKSGLQMLGIALIAMVCAISVMLLSAKVGAKLGRLLREKVFKKVVSFSTKELREFSTASLITRSTNDISQIQQMVSMMFRVIVYAPVIGIGGFIKVLTNNDNSMAWIIGVGLLAILFVVGTLFIIAMPKFKKLQDLTDRLNLVSREILTGLPVIRAFNKEKSEEARFEVANNDLKKTNIFVNKTMSIMMPMMMFIMNGMGILVIWVGGHSVDQGLVQVGDMMAFIQYMMQIVTAFLMISMISIALPRASISSSRINEVLETEPDIKDKKETLEFDVNKKGLVEFKNVSFKYPDAETEILEDINFIAEPGKTTAIIGSTGSGKSTIVNLLPRFYDVTNGEILIDGVNIQDVSQKKLRDIIGFVPQRGILFSGTIESNIKYADENISDEKMIEAAKIAQATEFIEKMEEKYKSPISQGGTNVSGGQKQRISIARAIAKDPEIFVFDDSFSALDFKTDSNLREALKQKTQNKTVIIVAQRISTILNADQIIVLDEGKIVGIGTHETLMKNNETYRQIALSQLSEEEMSHRDMSPKGHGEEE